MSDVNEKVAVFGPDESLVGVLTEPATPRGLGVLFLTAGVLHRVGPHRLHVTLARRAAERGAVALRFDIGGVGDSRGHQQEGSVADNAIADVRAAMSHVADETGVERFVLFGLCSGADHALATAVADQRVSGIIMLDPYAYISPQARARKLQQRIQKLGDAGSVLRWGARVGARKLRALVRRRDAPSGPTTQQGRVLPPAATYQAQLETLVARDTRVLAVYTGALDERYNHADQLFEVFPQLRGKIDARYFPLANHMFTELDQQRELATIVDGWLQRFYV